ncbi:HlyD family efflux transporter periplasmic adaptor subunit [bacterium]|nr:HlyD family efflux transporter periplasmic adaptor subunit [bacterium]
MATSLIKQRSLTSLARRGVIILAALAAIGALIYSFLPPVVLVDLASVRQGPLAVVVREEGKTRIRDRYVISSSLAGRLLRIELKPGDKVTGQETVLASIEPADPSLLDARSLAQAEAKVAANEAALQRAEAELKRSEASLERSQLHFKRIKSLQESRSASSEALEDAELALRSDTEQHAAARFNVTIARFELEQSRAALTHFRPNNSPATTDAEWRMDVHSPISGSVLRVLQESSAVVSPGTPIIEVGDPADLEIEVDVLSEDAVKIRSGQDVRVEQWGGGKTLSGVVRRVEPQAFTKVSALGVEEQRVNVIIDFAGPPEDRGTLGDSYRVETDIVIWKGDNVLQIPVSCLFRREDRWSVFVARDGLAELRPVEVGQKNSVDAQILSGLSQGETVIVHPGDQIKPGTKVKPRPI